MKRTTFLNGWLVVGLLTLLFGVVNWLWLQANVVTYGWDRMDHLITSLAYNNIFQTLTPQSLFDALAFADYYPPLFHFGMVLAYKIFGVNEDVGAMTNVLYIALLLGATWYVAKRVGGNGVAVLATVIIGTFPMIYIMSRYLYLDFALTALVAVALALLLASERFTRRTPSLLFGVALGLTFLVKWTAAAFLAAPLLYMLWRSGVLVGLLQHLNWLRPSLKRLAASFAISVVLIGAWLLPARAQVEQNPLGLWLFPIFILLLGFAVYALLPATFGASVQADSPLASTRQRVRHALGAGAVGAFVMGLWYAVNSEFIAGFFYTAYGREEGRFLAFDKYFYEIVTEQIGPFYALLFALVVVGWVVVILQKRGTPTQPQNTQNSDSALLFGLSDTVWVLVLWAVVPYLIFSAGVSLAHSRFLMPFLPPLAVAMAAGLWHIRNSALRYGAIALVVLVAVGQFALLSFDVPETVRARFIVPTPVGAVNLLAHGFFIQYPADGDTDPSYAIAPEILEIAEQARVAQGREFINVGVLVNSHQLHEKHFLYQIYIRYSNVLLRELARNWSEQPAYSQLFEMDYVLLSDTHSYRTSSESQEVLERLLYDDNDLFNQAFQPIREWTFLSGEHVTLYERRFAPTTPGAVVEDYQALVQAIGGEIGAGDELVLVAPDQAYMVGLTFPDGTGAKFTTSPDPATMGTFERVFLLAHNAPQSDPNREIEGWLRSNMVAGGDQTFNGVRVTPFIRATLPDSPTTTLNTTWENGTVLAGSATQQGSHALTARLFWNTTDTSAQKVSLQLLAADGTLLAQQDADLIDGVQSFALLVPRNATAGQYQLVAALYNPETMTRYTVQGGADFITIETLEWNE